MTMSPANDPRPELRIGHSPDPDDLFMWWPITGMLSPDAPHEPETAPVLDTGRFRYRGVPADIEVLNRRAGSTGDLEITALSYACYASVQGTYALTACGSSMGYGYGPKVVVRSDSAIDGMNLRCTLVSRGATLAVPGVRTTAFLVFSAMLGLDAASAINTVETPFDRIVPDVQAGRVDAGLVIHQAQIMVDGVELRAVADLGAWWLDHTELPLPLGANGVRRDLETIYGPGTMQEIAGTLARSIRHALSHRETSMKYVMRWAPELSRERAERYIDMYVNALTVDAGTAGEAAVRRLLEEGAALGRLAPVRSFEFVRGR
jgi:1,4-dihydroxy-6-naphthoate synthase